MFKGIISGFLYILSASAMANTLACPYAKATDDVNFCPSFRTAAVCHCTSSGLPPTMCQDMNAIYNRMLSVFGSLQRACEYQKATTTQDCIDNWNCYRLGGIDSRGRLCNATEKACV